MYIRTFVGIAFLALLSTASISSASDTVTDTGNQLIKSCNQKNYEESNLLWAWCVGYVSGVDSGFGIGARTAMSEAFQHFTHEQIVKLGNAVVDYCVPVNTTKEQTALVVSKFLYDHPETLNENNSSLIIDAFRAAWPCPTESQSKR